MDIDRRPVTRLKLTYIGALALIAVMTFVAHLILTVTVEREKADASVINVSGRQRMLSQKITKCVIVMAHTEPGDLAHESFREELRQANVVWRDSHLALQHGDENLGIPPLNNPEIEAMYAEMEPHFQAIQAAVLQIIDEVDVDSNAQIVMAHEHEFLKKQDEIVHAFEYALWAKVHEFQTYSDWVMYITFAALLLEALFVFEPAVRSMRRQLHQLTEAHEIMSHRARHDALTELPNRASLMQHLESLIAEQADQPDEEFAVMFMDLDRFKNINDTLGHDVGDQLLCSVAGRINALTQLAAPLKVQGYRLGGDEFVMVLQGHKATESVREFAGHAMEALGASHRLGTNECAAPASMGIVLSNRERPDVASILRDADLAMFHAKESGKGRYVLFDQSMYDYAQRRFEIERDLRLAIESDDLDLMYQPIYNADTKRAEAVEAMLYWEHPDHGVISNRELLEVAEETGLIHELGRWILQHAAEDTAAWPADPTLAHVRLHVNASRGEVLHPEFPGFVKTLLTKFPKLVGRLYVECAGAAVGRSAESFHAVLHDLHRAGVLFGLDDLDREQVAISQLTSLPIETIKIGIPMASTSKAQGQHAALSMIQALAAFGNNRGIDVVGTGIHTDDQVATAISIGATALQGMRLSPPVDVRALPDLIRGDKATA